MSGAGATYQNLISPRSRAPIVLSDDDDHHHHPERIPLRKSNTVECAESGILLPFTSQLVGDEVLTAALARRADRERQIEQVQGRPRPKSSIGFASSGAIQDGYGDSRDYSRSVEGGGGPGGEARFLEEVQSSQTFPRSRVCP